MKLDDFMDGITKYMNAAIAANAAANNYKLGIDEDNDRAVLLMISSMTECAKFVSSIAKDVGEQLSAPPEEKKPKVSFEDLMADLKKRPD